MPSLLALWLKEYKFAGSNHTTPTTETIKPNYKQGGRDPNLFSPYWMYSLLSSLV